MYMYPKVSETHPFVQGVQKCMLVIRKSKEHLRMRAESSKQSLSIFGHSWQHVLWTVEFFPLLPMSVSIRETTFSVVQII